MDYAVEINDLRKNYAGENALAGISLSVPTGSLFGVIGADGAGKTTLMRILATLIDADAGSARVLSLDVKSEPMQIRTSIGYMPQRFSLYEDLSVRENMVFFADIFGVRGEELERRVGRLLEFSRLGPFQDRRARYLSGGMKQKLALSCALIHTPRLLILDEPTTGVDPVSRMEFWKILSDLKKQGITIVVSTPYMDEAGNCDMLALMHRGKIILTGSPSQLTAQYPLRLYRVSSAQGALNVPGRIEKLENITSIYPLGGSLHVASELGEEHSEKILREVRSVAPKAETIAPVKAGIEDIFFYYLSKEEKRAIHN